MKENACNVIRISIRSNDHTQLNYTRSNQGSMRVGNTCNANQTEEPLRTIATRLIRYTNQNVKCLILIPNKLNM